MTGKLSEVGGNEFREVGYSIPSFDRDRLVLKSDGFQTLVTDAIDHARMEAERMYGDVVEEGDKPPRPGEVASFAAEAAATYALGVVAAYEQRTTE